MLAGNQILTISNRLYILVTLIAFPVVKITKKTV